MNDPVYTKLRETSWRRPLTEAEQAELRAWLAAHPEAKVAWETESSLTESLAALPDAPVPSNFTARVLQTVEREQAQRGRTRTDDWSWVWRVLVPRAAIAGIVATTCSFGYNRHVFARRDAQREVLAASVAAVAEVRSVSNTNILENFDVIKRLNQMPAPDNELLALLK